VEATAITRYSASVLERATRDYFLAVQETREEPTNIYLVGKSILV
jgi:hypothetical protein